ncbi:protein phosphatase [Nakamurella flavida]|uniref:PP2C family protein-serine/threonine phosphatase n=1 Tax=Nakamurella flavida TaxID=363630 RepID=UPI00278A7EB1|nr:PP2C family serine/threonine-protein phosphatase [Nakamurella flavida]MDP9778537.1 protein phosphatase [Nakamurella flavida]
MTHELLYAARTDRGLLRSNNQDSVYAGPRLLVVADGMGGHAAGDMASRLVVNAFAPLDEQPTATNLLRGLATAVRQGNAAIADVVDGNPELDGMGTTVTALLFAGDRLGMAHVGDSRAYLYRNGVLHQLTHDDTFVQSLIDDGRITADEAAHHPQRSLLLRALNGTDLDPSLTTREVSVGDRYLVCSDGLPAVVSPEAVADSLGNAGDPAATADALIQLALAGGGPDNITVIVADVVETGVDDEPWAAQDPDATGPIGSFASVRMTQEMPRVPLPGIPEDPPARPEFVTAPDDDDWAQDDDDTDPDDTDDDWADDESDPDTAATAPVRTGAAAPAAGLAAPTRARSWRRRGAFTLALVVLAAVAVGGSLLWVQSQHFVAAQDDEVTVFRGVNGSLFGWRLYSAEEGACTPGLNDCRPLLVADLVPAAQDQVVAGIQAGTLADARGVVSRLAGQLLPACVVPPAVSATLSAGTFPETTGATLPTSTGPSLVDPTSSAQTVPEPGTGTGTQENGTPGNPATGPTVPTTPASSSGTPLSSAAPQPGVTCRVTG